MKTYTIIFITLLSCLWACSPTQKQTCDLSGDWNFQLDPNNVGIQQQWNKKQLKEEIHLPGTTDEAGYGEKTKGSDYGILTRVHKYVGPAWYQRQIDIPSQWKGKNITLFLERVLWESKIFVDGKEMSTQDALGTPHVHTLGVLAPGKHQLTIRVDNSLIHNMGDKSHAYGEYTQTIWNGVVGKIQLMAHNQVNIQQIRTFSNAAQKELTVEINLSKAPNPGSTIDINIYNSKDNSLIAQKQTPIHQQQLTTTVPIASEIIPWDEFNPQLYRLEASLTEKNTKNQDTDHYQTTFGFRDVATSQSHILINQKPVFLRGNLDCVHFPLTGYPAMDVKEWKRIFTIYKDYGLNHVRFHSWCPPEAAFAAADQIGIYIQTEASTWIDWWMARTKEESAARPEMYTQGEPKGLGQDNPEASAFVKEEINRVIDTYGNHPSFIMFCIGNELGNSDFKVMGQWMKEAKIKDPRHLYAASTARTVTPYCDYSATHSYPGVGGMRQHMTNNTNWDYENNYSRTPVPVIAHEVGQWPVYPLWSEIDKYTGVLRARNLMQFKQQATENGIVDQDMDLHQASGKLSILLYKDEIESFMRTPSCAGVQLLSMQDYQGQGEALIGWLDCFWDSKGIITPEEFRQFSNTTVPLVKLPSYIYKSGDKLKAEVLLHHFGASYLKQQTVQWSLVSLDKDEQIIGDFQSADYEKGKLSNVGLLDMELPVVKKATQYTLSVSLPGTEYSNSWNLWIYPNKISYNVKSDILITEKLDKKALNKMEQGGKVMLMAHHCGDPSNNKYASWRPLYWSASFFPGQSIETIGLLLQNQHPAFNDFPTQMHSDWQWWNICKGAHGFVLDSLPKDYKPMAQPVSDFHFNHKLGSIFELKYGKGKLLVCGYNLTRQREKIAEVRQLKYSLLNYMNSSDFDPQTKVSKQFLKSTFKSFESAQSSAPKGFEDAILYVKASAKSKKGGDNIWKKQNDDILVAKKVDYKIIKGNAYKDNVSTCWFGPEMQIQIKTPEGIKGDFYVFFHDWNNQGRKGLVNFEGRDYLLGQHNKKGKWIKLNVMREDTNDGKLILKTKCTRGSNLMISAIAYIPKD